MMLFTIIYAMITVLLAWIEDKRIDATFGNVKNIKHIISVILAVIPLYLLISWMDLSYLVIINAALIRACIYDIALNLIREKDWDYVSDTTSSVLDKLERKIFPNFRVEKATYLILLIIFSLL